MFSAPRFDKGDPDGSSNAGWLAPPQMQPGFVQELSQWCRDLAWRFRLGSAPMCDPVAENIVGPRTCPGFGSTPGNVTVQAGETSRDSHSCAMSHSLWRSVYHRTVCVSIPLGPQAIPSLLPGLSTSSAYRFDTIAAECLHEADGMFRLPIRRREIKV